MSQILDVLNWCFQQNYHLDKSNAAIHNSPVKFSPLTFRIYEALMEIMTDDDITQEMGEVKSHRDTYEEDKGR